MIDVVVADLGGGRRVARADAGRAHARARPAALSLCSARSSSSAPASMQLRLSQTRIVTVGGPRLAIAHDVEVRVEGRDLVDLRHRDLELFRQRVQVALGQAALLVLDEVQVFDQQRALARALAEQRFDGGDLLLRSTRPRGNGAALRRPEPGWIERRPATAALRLLLQRRSCPEAPDHSLLAQRSGPWHTIYLNADVWSSAGWLGPVRC